MFSLNKSMTPSLVLLVFLIFLLINVYGNDEQCPLNQKLIIDEFKESHKVQNTIPIKVYKHHGHHTKYGDLHPNNLLLPTKNEWYCSKLVRNMNGNYWCKIDWIIFKIDDKKNDYLPSKISILNHDAEAAVKYMSVYIGNAETNTWYRLEENPLTFKMRSDERQSIEFKYESIKWNFNDIINESSNLKYIKVELLDNHMGDGKRFKDSCSFLFYHLSISGYKLSS